MLDTIFIGMSGLSGYAKGLRVIGNNLANVNTPGFKGSQLQFADMFYRDEQGGSYAGAAQSQLGAGLNTLSTLISFKPGELHQTGNDLDLAVEGNGFFVLKEGDALHFTRSGQFRFDSDGFLVSQSSGLRVESLDKNGQLVDISSNGLRSHAPQATQTIHFSGNLSSNTTSDVTLDNVKVIDPNGGEHLIKLTFKNHGIADAAATPGSWTATLSDENGAVIGMGELQFDNGVARVGNDTAKFSYKPSGAASFSFALDLSKDVTSFASGEASTLAVSSQDGFGAGVLTSLSFDAEGTLVAKYSNGQSVKDARLALAQFDSNEALTELGGSEFSNRESQTVRFGHAKSDAFGSLSSGVVEGANVDMAEEFSNLIVMQRGYQASSHVISTANDMIQELFDMKGHR